MDTRFCLDWSKVSTFVSRLFFFVYINLEPLKVCGDLKGKFTCCSSH